MPLNADLLDRLAKLHGLIPDALGETLAELAAAVPRDRCIVEIGSYCGKSTCYLAHGAMSGYGAPVFAIDPWDTDGNPTGRFGFAQQETRLRFQQQVHEAGCSHQVTAFRAFSQDMARVWQRPIGLLYIDGSHTEADVQRDVTAWTTFLSSGSVVAFDDYRTQNNPGVEKVVDRLKASTNWTWVEGPKPLIYGLIP